MKKTLLALFVLAAMGTAAFAQEAVEEVTVTEAVAPVETGVYTTAAETAAEVVADVAAPAEQQ
jgi:hypothetical protein